MNSTSALTVQQAATRLGVSRQTVVRLILSGELTAFEIRTSTSKKKTSYRIRQEVLDRFVLARERQLARKIGTKLVPAEVSRSQLTEETSEIGNTHQIQDQAPANLGKSRSLFRAPSVRAHERPTDKK